MDEILKEISDWINYQLKLRNKDGIVFGVSGGVDSTTLAKIIEVNTIDNIAINIIYEKNCENADLCIEYIKNLKNINFKTINISEPYNSLVSCLNKIDKDIHLYLELNTNIKARLREIVFYHFAKINNYLVVGTINKAEFQLGYFVKNSSIGDILPFADISKNEIRRLATYLGIPHNIVTKKASGCVKDSYAEDEWGIKENEIDNIIHNHLSNLPIEKIQLFYEMFSSSSHKREFPPVFKSPWRYKK
jgi:NAD+ synthase